jgi:hypothetical protein
MLHSRASPRRDRHFMGRGCFRAWLFLVWWMIGCQGAPPPSAVSGADPSPLNQVHASRDLSRDEAAGGHTLRKHVGRSDAELLERLGRERHIAAASTYTDQETAERAVGAAIQSERTRINSWVARKGGHPNLVLDYDAEQRVGRTIHRGQDKSELCSHLTVVLRWAPPEGYYVLTSYPECR